MLSYLTMIIGSFMYISETVILKKFKHISLVNKLFIICLSAMIPSLLVTYKYKNFDFMSLFTNKNRLLVGLLMTIFFISAYNGYKILPTSYSVPLFMTTPLLMMIFDGIIENSKLNIKQLLCGLFSFIGVLIVSFEKVNIDKSLLKTGIISMIVGIVTYSLAYTLQKYTPERTFLKGDSEKEDRDKKKPIIERVHLNLLNIFTLPFIVVSLLSLVDKKYFPSTYRGKTPTMKEFITLILVFLLLNYGHNVAFFYSYNNLPINIYGALENTNVIASLIIGSFFLKEKITIRKIIGCLVIITGIIGNIKYKNE